MPTKTHPTEQTQMRQPFGTWHQKKRHMLGIMKPVEVGVKAENLTYRERFLVILFGYTMIALMAVVVNHYSDKLAALLR